MEKNFIYVGHYTEPDGTYVLKIGTTNNLERRQKEHTKHYKNDFVYDWYKEVSKYTALRVEDDTRAEWKERFDGAYVRNDRFRIGQKPQTVTVTIRKQYVIEL